MRPHINKWKNENLLSSVCAASHPLRSVFPFDLHLLPSSLPQPSALSGPSLPLVLSLSSSPSLSGWVPAVRLLVLVAGVTALLSGVAADQGGRRAGEADRS